MFDTHTIKRILFQYDLEPLTVDRKGHVYKIVTSWGAFALKPLSSGSEETLTHIFSLLRQLSVKSPPVIPTKFGKFIASDKELSYYLTPWMDDHSLNNERKLELLVEQLAMVHNHTIDHSPRIKSEPSLQSSIHYKLTKRQTHLEAFAYRAEHQPYPSPFEQRFLLLFHRMMADIELSKKMMDTLGEQTWRSIEQKATLCHGRPQLDHIILSENGPFFINFSHAYWGSPVHDLVAVIRLDEVPSAKMRAIYDQYQKTHKLTMDEQKLLVAELLQPELFEGLIGRYSDDQGPSELRYLSELHKLAGKRQQLQVLITSIEQEIAKESEVSSEPSLSKTDIQTDE